MHVVVFRWREGVPRVEIGRVAAGLDALAREIQLILSLEHGPDLGFRDGNGDYVLIAWFADRAAWDAYQAHPSHKTFLDDCIVPILASRTTIQFITAANADLAIGERK